MFSESASFYYSDFEDGGEGMFGDLTSCVQRQHTIQSPSSATEPPSWKDADDRFFWNKEMLKDLIDSQVWKRASLQCIYAEENEAFFFEKVVERCHSHRV